MPTKAQYLRTGSTPYMEQLFISTADRYRGDGKIEDNYFKKWPLLAWLLDRKDTTLMAGGEQFVVPLEIGENPNGGMITEEQAISMDDYDPFDGAIYYAKHCGYGLRWSKEHQRVNRGNPVRFKLVDKKMDNTYKTMKKTLNLQVISGQGGSTTDSESLETLIPATASGSQTTSIGGISPSTNSWWRTNAINMNGLIPATDLELKMINGRNTIMANGGKLDLVFTDQDTYETYEQNQMEYLTTGPTKFADVTFELPQFKKVPILFDTEAPDGEMRLIDNDAIIFCVDPMYWFEWTQWKPIPNVAFTKVQQCVLDFNLARTNPRKLLCIYNIA